MNLDVPVKPRVPMMPDMIDFDLLSTGIGNGETTTGKLMIKEGDKKSFGVRGQGTRSD